MTTANTLDQKYLTDFTIRTSKWVVEHSEGLSTATTLLLVENFNGDALGMAAVNYATVQFCMTEIERLQKRCEALELSNRNLQNLI